MLLLLLACAHHTPPEAVKTHGNLPILTESELAAEIAARVQCIEACTDDACRAKCDETNPVRQVEVVPDGLVAP